MDSVPSKVDSKFRFVLLAAGRAEQLMRGAAPKVSSTPGKPTEVALEEVRNSLVPWDRIELPEEGAEETPEAVEAAPAE